MRTKSTLALLSGVSLAGVASGDTVTLTGAEGLAVVGVEVPLATDRLLAVHQHAVLFAQLAVPVFQPQLLAALGVGGELAQSSKWR